LDDPVFRKKVVVMIQKGWSPQLIAGRWSKTGGAPCPMDANLKICWRFCTTALRQKLTRLHCSVGVSSMAFCQWALRSTEDELTTLNERAKTDTIKYENYAAQYIRAAQQQCTKTAAAASSRRDAPRPGSSRLGLPPNL
jgi:hypothetical protein